MRQHSQNISRLPEIQLWNTDGWPMRDASGSKGKNQNRFCVWISWPRTAGPKTQRIVDLSIWFRRGNAWCFTCCNFSSRWYQITCCNPDYQLVVNFYGPRPAELFQALWIIILLVCHHIIHNKSTTKRDTKAEALFISGFFKVEICSESLPGILKMLQDPNKIKETLGADKNLYPYW